MKRLLLLLLTVALSVNGFSQERYMVRSQDDVFEHYLVGKAKLAQQGDVKYLEFWVRMLPGEGHKSEYRATEISLRKKDGLSTKGFDKLEYSLNLMNLDLINKRVRVIECHYYDNEGHIIDWYKLKEYETDWDNVIPGSVVDGMIDFFVKKKNSVKENRSNTLTQ